MSKINIQGVVDDIKGHFSVYAPLLEAVVNSIQSIEQGKITNGKIRVVFEREYAIDFGDDALPEIKNITVIDNGVGFTEINRDSFDTYRGDIKKDIGGKGFGRFLFLKFFSTVKVESVYRNNGQEFYERKFNFGKNFSIIEDETNVRVNESQNKNKNVTKVYFNDLKDGYSFGKQLETIGRKLLENLLIYFVDNNFTCPEIWLEESDGTEKIQLNEFLSSRKEIQLIKSEDFTLENEGRKEKFTVKIFKIYYTNKISRITLVAQKREVTETPIHKFIPEFSDDFYEEIQRGKQLITKNYIIKAYVLGKYLTDNVSLARDKFNFDKERPDVFYPFAQQDIEYRTSNIVKEVFQNEVKLRSEKKREQIIRHVNDNAPWHKPYINDIDLSSFSFNAPTEKIEMELQKYKFQQELQTKKDVRAILEDTTTEYEKRLESVLSKITQIGKSDLAHYVSNRKVILDILEKLLNRKNDGSPEYEKDIHNLIFPMGKDDTEIEYENHNLWLFDERLAFTHFIASDRKISSKNSLIEPDLVVFDKKRAYRSGDNEFSNPLTIFEFKRPKREVYGANDDPVIQLGKYLEEIRAGKYETPGGVEKIKVNNSTPVYGYIICDLVNKIKEFARNHQLTLSPDEEGYFGFHVGFGMYVEIISFKKLMKDANLRNKIFFKNLQIS